MMTRKTGKMFNEAFLLHERSESQKNKRDEKASKVVFTVKSIIIMSLSFLSL
ncbi:MAG TPA: hypothetical protein VK469_14180 [Candidatus Kapabacteria bacterium]|nr:hypothetical protein [Candidatus Kapabacteria bacterium]